MMALRDAAGIRLLTRNGSDWSERLPAVVAAVSLLKLKSCLIDGEAIVATNKVLPCSSPCAAAAA
jgi:bifunctional non-homologous end joining protein LigD